MDPLAELHDIAIPPGVDILPLAIGWWVIIAISVLSFTWGWLKLLRYFRLLKPLRIARKRAKALSKQGQLSAQTANELMRRVVMTYAGRDKVGSQHTKQWAKTLFLCLPPKQQTPQIKEQLLALTSGIYRADYESKPMEIEALLSLWLQKVKVKTLLAAAQEPSRD